MSCPPDTVINFHHKDVVGVWFVAPVKGIIDTLFWIMGDTVGAKDSAAYLRPSNSRITPAYGPGVNYPDPPMPWGYFINTNDLDRGIAAFPEDATPLGPSSWTSTSPVGPPTEPPCNEYIWGFGGFGITLHAGKVNALPLIDGGTNLYVEAGQSIFLPFRIKAPDVHVDDPPTQFLASHSCIATPSHIWTFFEHDSMQNPGAVKGWWAVAGANINIWYSMLISSTDISVPIRKNWNLLSLPIDVASNAVSDNFPTATSGAFRYSAGTYKSGSAMEYGGGYWIKFPDTLTHVSTGLPRLSDTADVSPGWNIVGGNGTYLATTSISTAPPGIVTSNFWGYDSAYHVATMLVPGHGYWVKVHVAGKMFFSSTGSPADQPAKMAFNPNGDLPPPPPPDGEIPTPKPRSPGPFYLSQNYPNPFNPSTTIYFTLPEAQHVRLVLYNLLGQVVATLLDGYEEAGITSVRFDASGLTSGIYYYRVNAGSYEEVKKMVVAR